MNGFILTKRKLATGIMRKCLPYEMSAMYLYINENKNITVTAFILHLNIDLEINCSNSVSLDATLKHGRVV